MRNCHGDRFDSPPSLYPVRWFFLGPAIAALFLSAACGQDTPTATQPAVPGPLADVGSLAVEGVLYQQDPLPFTAPLSGATSFGLFTSTMAEFQARSLSAGRAPP
jgi:hypothetical protein